MTGPDSVNQKPINVVQGMTVKQVQQQGTKAQADAASLFDLDSDGVYSKDEAKAFNNFDITKEDGGIFMKSKEGNHEIRLKYDNPEQLNGLTVTDYCRLEHKENGENNDYAKDTSVKVYDEKSMNVEYDLNNKTLKIANKTENREGSIKARNLNSVEIENSDVEDLDAIGTKNVKLTNVQDRGLWNSKSTVYVDGNANLDFDAETQAKVERE